MKHILIITGGSLDLSWAGEWIRENPADYVIAADKGLEYCRALQVKVDYILGDYDSISPGILEEYKNTETITYPAEKDYTDTHLAILHALSMHPSCISILGGTGTRYDHAMTNIYVMMEALREHVPCTMYDPCNKIYLADGPFRIQRQMQYGQFLSFVPITESVQLSLRGVRYPLEQYELKQGCSVCQSNEIKAEEAEILILKGKVVVFETKNG